MPIDPDTLSTLARDYAQGMTSIRGRRVQRLLLRTFAGADHVLVVRTDAGAAAVLGVSASGAALCATNGRGPRATVLQWRHGAAQALEIEFDLLKDALPVLATRPSPLGGRGRLRLVSDSVPRAARALVSQAVDTLK